MSILFNKNPLVVNPELAELIGLNEAIILQQLHYWIQKSNFEKDGKKWVYNSYKEWQKQFKFWSVDTIKRTMNKLKKMNLIEIKQLSNSKLDKTNYYSINYQELELLSVPNAKGQNAPMENSNLPQREGQNAPMEECKMPSSYKNNNLITETTTETTNRDYTENKYIIKPLSSFEKCDECKRKAKMQIGDKKLCGQHSRIELTKIGELEAYKNYLDDDEKTTLLQKCLSDYNIQLLLKEMNLENSQLAELLEYRKELKKPLKTIRGVIAMLRNIQATMRTHNKTFDEVFEIMAENEWQSIKPEYIANLQAQKRQSSKKDIVEAHISEAQKAIAMRKARLANQGA